MNTLNLKSNSSLPNSFCNVYSKDASQGKRVDATPIIVQAHEFEEASVGRVTFYSSIQLLEFVFVCPEFQ